MHDYRVSQEGLGGQGCHRPSDGRTYVLYRLHDSRLALPPVDHRLFWSLFFDHLVLHS